MQKLKFWLLALRPKTLTAALVPIMVGTAFLHAFGYPLEWWISLNALAASLFIQFGTNLVNDAMDFKKGADTEKRLGPQRVTQTGVFSYKSVMMVASLFFLVAVAFGVPLVMHGGTPILLIGLCSVLFGYLYTAGPYPLAYVGLGDLFVILFFGLVAVGGLVFLQLASVPQESLVLGLQVGFLAAVLIAINNLRDIEGDKLAHKKTLPVRFGKTFARYEIAFLSLLPFVGNILWFQKGKLWAALLPFLVLPLAFKLIRRIFQTEPSAIYNQYLAQAAGLHLFFGLLISIGFIL